ncbi:MAG: type II toxin-antitoxin system RelE/ParE family toxin [Pseudomonadota bacterium]
MSRYALTSDAERDLIDIYLQGLETYGVKQAEDYQDILAAKLEMLSENPSFGADYGDLRAALRRAETPAHSIYYHETDSGILVLRILYKSMDPARHLQG